MNRSYHQKLLRLLNYFAESPGFAYVTIVLLQIKVMLWIWNYRDLTPGDTSYYYMNVYSWLDGANDIFWSPAYVLFLAALHRIIHDPFLVLIVAQIIVATCASVMILSLLRCLLPKYLAWIIAAWWVLLPINFDTVYSVHLFSALFPLAVFVIAAYINNIYGRGIVLGAFLLTAVLVRYEYFGLFGLILFVIAGYDFYLYRWKDRSHSMKTYFLAYGLPMLFSSLVIVCIYAGSAATYPEIKRAFETKQTFNVGQIYAYNRRQQGDSWKGNPWTEYQSLIERDFGRSAVTYSQAFSLNPRVMLEHIWWNIKIIPSATQLALFNFYAGGTNPDYIRAKNNPLVWIPFFLVTVLSAFAAMRYFIIPAWKKGHTVENRFVWFLMSSTAFFLLGIMMMVLPRPSYMFPYSVFIMALAGLGLHGLFGIMRMRNVVNACCPMVGILLILFVPSYYDADYINHFGYKGQPLRDNYERLAPHINRTSFGSPAVMVTPEGDYTDLCNYLGITCRTLPKMGNISDGSLMALDFSDSVGEHVYILYLEDMIWKFHSTTNQEKKEPINYVELSCFSRANNIITCSDGQIDLNRGFMNNYSIDIPLRAALFINDGHVVERRDYDHDEGYYLQVLMKKNKVFQILVADEHLFRTSFNQQYLLGNLDRRYFEEVYNDFPAARVLKVKRSAFDI